MKYLRAKERGGKGRGVCERETVCGIISASLGRGSARAWMFNAEGGEGARRDRCV